MLPVSILTQDFVIMHLISFSIPSAQTGQVEAECSWWKHAKPLIVRIWYSIFCPLFSFCLYRVWRHAQSKNRNRCYLDYSYHWTYLILPLDLMKHPSSQHIWASIPSWYTWVNFEGYWGNVLCCTNYKEVCWCFPNTDQHLLLSYLWSHTGYIHRFCLLVRCLTDVVLKR